MIYEFTSSLLTAAFSSGQPIINKTLRINKQFNILHVVFQIKKVLESCDNFKENLMKV